MVQDNGPRIGFGGALSEAPAFWSGPDPTIKSSHSNALTTRIAMGRRPGQNTKIRVLLLGDDTEAVGLIQMLLERTELDSYSAHWLHEIPLNFHRDGADWDAVVIVGDPELTKSSITLTALRAAGLSAPILLVASGIDDEAIERAIDRGAAEVLEAIDLDVETLDRGIRTSLARHARDCRLHQAARRDDLTGLANRASFRDRLDHALTLARRGDGKLALLLIDLNDFKAINDRFGHPGGDELLRRIGERMRARMRESDTVARLGGDEFGVLLPNIARPEDAAVVVRKLIEAIRAPVDLDGQAANVTASIGVAIFPDHAQDPTKLIRLADAAMYRAKHLDGSGCCWHDETRPLACPEAEELLEAFASDRVTYTWRPQVALEPGRVAVGIRPVWRHPQSGVLDLLTMRPLLEEAGLIEELTERLLVVGLKRLVEWRRHGFDRVRISVPMLSRRRLAWAELAARMEALARAHEIRTDRLEIEIDEQLLIDDLLTGGHGAAAFARAGVPIAIDRFGNGAMAVGLFNEVRPATIRFCPAALGWVADPDRLAAFQAVAGLARRLSIHTVATGADDVQRMDMARRIGVEAVESRLGHATDTELCLSWLQVATRRAS